MASDKIKPFSWGRVLERFSYDFDGIVMEVIKFHPHKFENGHQVIKQGRAMIDEDKVEYHCDEISQSSMNLFRLVLAWITFKQLGQNQSALVVGFARALKLKIDE